MGMYALANQLMAASPIQINDQAEMFINAEGKLAKSISTRLLSTT